MRSIHTFIFDKHNNHVHLGDYSREVTTNMISISKTIDETGGHDDVFTFNLKANIVDKLI